MTDTGEQPVGGSLYAVVIRACQAHGPNCKKHRKIEDLGEIASFGVPLPTAGPPPRPGPDVAISSGVKSAGLEISKRVKRLFRKE